MGWNSSLPYHMIRCTRWIIYIFSHVFISHLLIRWEGVGIISIWDHTVEPSHTWTWIIFIDLTRNFYIGFQTWNLSLHPAYNRSNLNILLYDVLTLVLTSLSTYLHLIWSTDQTTYTPGTQLFPQLQAWIYSFLCLGALYLFIYCFLCLGLPPLWYLLVLDVLASLRFLYFLFFISANRELFLFLFKMFIHLYLVIMFFYLLSTCVTKLSFSMTYLSS